MFRRKQTTFMCFSPPVMVATFIIEIVLLVYTLWRYKRTHLTWLIALMLLFLASFQLAEFQVCTGTAGLAQWSHFGYIAITALPALGIHVISIMHKKSNRRLVWAAYGSSAVFIAYFLLSASSLQGQVCLGNYVTFRVNPEMTWMYALYYYGWLVITMLLSWIWGRRERQRQRRLAFFGFALGYAAFLLPTTTVNLLNSATTNGIPSIMCGFAVLFALVLVLIVAPRIAKPR